MSFCPSGSEGFIYMSRMILSQHYIYTCKLSVLKPSLYKALGDHFVQMLTTYVNNNQH